MSNAKALRAENSKKKFTQLIVEPTTLMDFVDFFSRNYA